MLLPISTSGLFLRILPMILAFGTFMIGFQWLMIKLERKLKAKYGESPQKRIERLTRNLREASQLTTQIESEIAARHDVVKKLQGDIDRFQELAKLKGSEVEAIAQTLRGELKKEGTKSFWISIALNLAFFVAGSLLTVYMSKPI